MRRASCNENLANRMWDRLRRVRCSVQYTSSNPEKQRNHSSCEPPPSANVSGPILTYQVIVNIVARGILDISIWIRAC
jgi:hypothetical protein